MAKARFSIPAAAADGIEFWRTNWRKVPGALALAAIASVAMQANLPADGQPQITAQFIAGMLIVMLAQIPAQAALLRIALHDLGAEPPARNGPFGLQWRMLETRLLAASALTVLLVFVVTAVTAFLMLALTAGFLSGIDPKTLTTPEAVAAHLSPSGALVLQLVLLAFLIGVVVLSLRLSLVQPATAVANRTQVFSSLRLTRGAILPIFGTLLLINLPLLILEVLGELVAGSDPMLRVGVGLVLGGIAPFFLIPISVGVTAHIYRRLTSAGGAA